MLIVLCETEEIDPFAVEAEIRLAEVRRDFDGPDAAAPSEACR
jgi:hypothetical protein